MLKKYLLSLILLFGGVSLSLNAQSDSFFRNGYDNDYTNRDNITNDITLGGVTNDENPTVPVGSGLLIMVAAGAGYTVARRKGAARKGMTMILALGLILGMTQCKKNTVTPVTPAGNSVHITLNANFGGEKTGFDPANGTFNWSNGTTEFINVGGKKTGYLGQLQGTWSEDPTAIVFSGNITPASDEEMLYFFYLGNGDHASATTLDFSNQVGDLDHITNWHIAIGNATYTPGQTSFTTTLDMAMAIAYFDLSGFTSSSNTNETVYVHGDDVYTTAAIDYKNGTITGNSKGFINVGTANAGKYVALIPSVTTETEVEFDSNSKTGSMTFNNGIKPASFYSNNHQALAVTATAGTGIPGTFSVSASKKVFFSKGNLQYQASTGTWRFAENQYDYVGDATNGNVYVDEVKSNNANIASDYTGWIDLFGWGTGNNPTQTSTNVSDYSTFTDWGTNSISNGDGYTRWRTLTKDEWSYMIGSSSEATSNCRISQTSGLTGTNYNTARFTKATVNGVCGLVVFPDIYTQPSDASVTYNNTVYNSFYSMYNTFTVTSGWDKMESAGAIFIPSAGYRNGTTIDQVNTYAYYYSSTPATNSAYSLYFYNSGLNPANNYTKGNKEYGKSVRLVRE